MPDSAALDFTACRALVADLVAEAGGQTKFAAAHGLHQGQISKFLSGKRDLALATARQLADSSGLDLEDLLAGRRPASRRLLLRLSDILVHSRQNPRRKSGFEKEAIAELADSIAAQGLLQPLVVTENPPPFENYSLVAGERRYRALSLLIDRGHEAFLQHFPGGGIPCELRTIGKKSDGGAGKLTAALAENLARADLAPWEITQALAILQETSGRTAKEIAGDVGLSERRAQQHLQIARELPDRDGEAWDRYLAGTLDFAEARQIVQVRKQEPEAAPEDLARNSNLASLGKTPPASLRRTPDGQPLADQLVKPGDWVETNYRTGPYRVVETTWHSYDHPESGESYPSLSLHCCSRRAKGNKPDSWINECVAVDGRLLHLFPNNDDEVFKVEAPEAADQAAEVGDQVDLEELIDADESETHPARPNATPPEERIVVYEDGRGHDAVIGLARIEGAWRYGYRFWTGSLGGQSAPSHPSNPSFPTRDAALQAAARYLAKAHLDNLESNSSAVSEATRRRCRKVLKALADHLAPEDAHLAIPPAASPAPEAQPDVQAEAPEDDEDLERDDEVAESDETSAAKETAAEAACPVDIETLRECVGSHQTAGLALAADALLRPLALIAIEPATVPQWQSMAAQANDRDRELDLRLSPVWDQAAELGLPTGGFSTRAERLQALLKLPDFALCELICAAVAERLGPVDPTGDELLRALALATGAPLLEEGDDPRPRFLKEKESGHD